jgi:addiction module toxin component, YafQ family/addiction module toxin, RelE/StbE family
MLNQYFTNQFKKDLKKADKANLDISELEKVINTLASEKPLDVKYKDHILKGDYVNHRECHIRPDWLLIYQIEKDTLKLVRTGTHSELY